MVSMEVQARGTGQEAMGGLVCLVYLVYSVYLVRSVKQELHRRADLLGRDFVEETIFIH